jgi:hypothetical protein
MTSPRMSVQVVLASSKLYTTVRTAHLRYGEVPAPGACAGTAASRISPATNGHTPSASVARAAPPVTPITLYSLPIPAGSTSLAAASPSASARAGDAAARCSALTRVPMPIWRRNARCDSGPCAVAFIRMSPNQLRGSGETYRCL